MILLAGIPFGIRASFDPGLLKLQAPSESVSLVRKLQTWSAVVLSKDLGKLREVREKLRGSELVDHTESILEAYDNADWLGTHAAGLPAIAWAEPDAIRPADVGRIAASARALARQLSASPAAEQLTAVADQLAAAESAGPAAGAEAAARL